MSFCGKIMKLFGLVEKECDICNEKKYFFVTCPRSDKHTWCHSCDTSIIHSKVKKCPYCRCCLEYKEYYIVDSFGDIVLQN